MSANRALLKARKEWSDTIALVQQFAAEHHLTVELRNPSAPEYQIARLTGEGVRLIVYPHQQTNGTRHARIRSENSADVAKAETLMVASGMHVNNRPDIWFHGRVCANV
jgi:hypothetical protein